MTQFVPNSYPDFDTDSSGMHVAFRDRGGSHHGLVTYQTGPGGGVGITQIVSLTQAQYDAIATKDPATLYVIVEG